MIPVVVHSWAVVMNTKCVQWTTGVSHNRFCENLIVGFQTDSVLYMVILIMINDVI